MNTRKIYHVMTDRFYPVNNKAKGRCFRGGNIRGIIEKLDYIQFIGMEGIMLTPFYKTNEYHGYHITDYTEVDPHFGTWDDIRELVREVHNRNMIIVADFVPNHCHKSNPLYADGKHDDWFLKDKNGKIKGFANLNELPVFDTDNTSVQAFFIELCAIFSSHFVLVYIESTKSTFGFGFCYFSFCRLYSRKLRTPPRHRRGGVFVITQTH